MPFYLKDRDISTDIAAVHSVLIVPCRFCPAASLAVRERQPYIELFRKFLRTLAYKRYIQAILAFNTLVAVGALLACQEAGKIVPEDVAIIGADDIPLISLIYPPLSTSRVNLAQIGRLSM